MGFLQCVCSCILAGKIASGVEKVAGGGPETVQHKSNRTTDVAQERSGHLTHPLNSWGTTSKYSTALAPSRGRQCECKSKGGQGCQGSVGNCATGSQVCHPVTIGCGNDRCSVRLLSEFHTRSGSCPKKTHLRTARHCQQRWTMRRMTQCHRLHQAWQLCR
mmetsp:Transcript_73359/g.119057  ORF Transcript_73359/g.119057 Transcript_73359/m.119057 type:complete len:161 (-) Transcript_73359:1500-1982(-)